MTYGISFCISLVWILLGLCFLGRVQAIPSPCVFWDTCKIGLIYSSVGIYAPYSMPGVVVANMYVNHVNDPSNCGIGQTGIKAQLITYDIQSNASLVAGATLQLITQDQIDILILPEGPLSIYSAPVANPYNIPLISGMSGVQSLYLNAQGTRLYKNVVGVVTPAPLYMQTFLRLMINQNYNTISVISTATSPDQDVCNGVSGLAIYAKMSVVSFDYVNPEDSASFQTVLQKINALNPDIVISCMLLYCNTLFDTIKLVDVNPRAHGTFECINTEETFNKNLYVFSPSQWDKDVFDLDYIDTPGRAYGNMFPYDPSNLNSIPSSLQFYNAYSALTDGNTNPPMTSLTAAQLAAFYVIDYGIHKANTTSYVFLYSEIQAINIRSFFGLISFDDNGQNSNLEMVVVQAVNADTSTVVYPGRTIPVLPMPTFSERIFDNSVLTMNTETGIIIISALLTACSFFLWIVIMFNKRHVAVQNASVVFSSVMILGCIFFYWTHVTWGINNNDTMCQSRVAIWLFSLIFTISPLIAISYRVDKILNYSKLLVQKLTDRKLFFLMTGFMAPGVLLILLWGSVQPLVLHTMIVDPYRASLNYTDCYAPSNAFPILMCIYVSCLLLTALYIGYRIRKIDSVYQQYSHAKFIGILVFMITVLIAIVSPIQIYSSAQNRTVMYVIRSISSIAIAVLTQVLFFQPILMGLFKQATPMDSFSGTQLLKSSMEDKINTVPRPGGPVHYNNGGVEHIHSQQNAGVHIVVGTKPFSNKIIPHSNDTANSVPSS